jgi:hypothetical protein
MLAGCASTSSSLFAFDSNEKELPNVGAELFWIRIGTLSDAFLTPCQYCSGGGRVCWQERRSENRYWDSNVR